MTFTPNNLCFLPLGGCGEIGMNLNLYGYQGQWLMVDCGITFADDRWPGVEVIVPDASFIIKNKDKLAGILLTHAHEDHLGAVPYLWPHLQVPVYATGFAASVLKRKLAETNFGKDVPIHILPLSSTTQIGHFGVQLITLTHSILEPNAVVIRTPQGIIAHTGDWKLDPNPILGDVTDEAALKALAAEKPLAMVCDSTNALVEGHTASEGDVATALLETIAPLKSRVFVTCFASNAARLHSIMMAAAAASRKVCLLGRSLGRIVQAAQENGYLKDIPPMVDEETAGDMPPRDVLYIVTGSQGEPRAMLARLAFEAKPPVRISAGDAVLFSSRVIPGNERAIGRLQNALAAKGAKIITDRQALIHVSGHPAQEELKEMYGWVKPQCLIPVHGEARHMQAQAELAKAAGVPHTLTIQNGDVVEFNKEGKASVVDSVEVGYWLVQGNRLLPTKSPVVRQTQKAMRDGVAVVSIVLHQDGDGLAEAVRLSTVALLSHEEEITASITFEKAFEEMLDAMSDANYKKDDHIFECVKKLLRKQLVLLTGKKPAVLVHLFRV
jgi:ribonuclease J